MSIKETLSFFKKAKYPEEVFGDDPDIKEKYRELAKVVHPDSASTSEKSAAHEAFLLLQKWLDLAEDKIKNKTYGDKKLPILFTINTKNTYDFTELIKSDEIFDYFQGGEFTARVCRESSNNDLARADFENLKKVVDKTEDKFLHKFPIPIESVLVDRKQINIVKEWKGFSLKEIKEKYKSGVDQRDAAWMFNRILEVLHLVHSKWIVYGAITPDNIILDVETHLGRLNNFSYSVKSGTPIKAITEWTDFYPSEVINKKPADFSTDLFMASKLLEWLVYDMPKPIKNIMNACQLSQPFRYKSVEMLYKEMEKTLEKLYGKKKFRVFSMK